MLMMISFVSAEMTHKQNTNLIFSITSNFADQCVLTTINTPTDVLFINQNGTKNSQTFNYTMLSGNFTELGNYRLNIECADSTDKITEFEDVEVTPTGESTNGWKISLQLFVSLSCLVLMFLFMYLANSEVKQDHISKEEHPAISILFIGISLVFLIAHIIITNVIVHDTLGTGTIAGAYTNVMYIFFTIIVAIFIFTISKIGFNVVSMLQKGRGLK
jgi:hypothetical protein